MSSKAFLEAQEQLTKLLEDARTGAIIPIRLPRQIEEIETLLQTAATEHQEEIDTLKNAPGGDAGAVILENAEFLKIAVHELRNPMTSIRGYTDMLNNPSMGGELSDMQKQLLDVVRANARRMEGLLADISYINKIQANILPVKMKMDLYKNIAMMAEKKAAPIAEELNRQLVFETPEGLPILNIDGDHLSHAMTKLIENGLRYSPEETGKVIVRASKEDSSLVIDIEDNGVGITEDELAHLGELFFRSDNDVVRAYKGSGLGIPIAYGLIELINGKIDVTSIPESGTHFTITLAGMV